MSNHVTTRDGSEVAVAWHELAGTRVGIVLWGGLAAVDVARVAGLPSYAVLGALAVLVALTSVGMSTTSGLCGAVVGWLLDDGFVEHRYGVLGFDAAHDTLVLSLLVGVALTVTRSTGSAGSTRSTSSTGARR